MNNQPSHEEQRYDRQIRIWNDSGQRAIQQAHIVAANASPVTCSALKNLVLPGTGIVSLVDGESTQEADIQRNFFLSAHSLNRPRAQEAALLLKELNPSVDLRAEQRLDINPTHAIVISGDQPEFQLTRNIAHACWAHDVPFLSMRTRGFYGMIQVQYMSLPVIHVHPDNPLDLALQHPPAGLVDYANTFTYDGDEFARAHIPPIVILCKELTTYPVTFHERREFIKKLKDLGSQVSPSDPENFEQAAAFFRRSSTTKVPPHVQDLLTRSASVDVSSLRSSCLKSFWALVKSLAVFVKTSRDAAGGAGYLPVSGDLPDMKSDSDAFAEIQGFYKEQHLRDVSFVHRIAQDYANVPYDVAVSFVKNAAHIKLLETPKLGDHPIFSEQSRLEDWDDALNVFIAFHVMDLFVSINKRQPNVSDEPFCRDLVLESVGLAPSSSFMSVLHHFLEYHDSFPQVVSFIAGLAAQEATKIVSGHYTPIASCLVYDGVLGTTHLV